MRSKQDELEVCVQVQGYVELNGIMEMWGTAQIPATTRWLDIGSFAKDTLGWWRVELPCPWERNNNAWNSALGGEPAETLWIWISGQNNMGNVLLAVVRKMMMRKKY